MLIPDVVDPLNRPTGFKYLTIVFPQGDDRDDQTLKSLFVSDFSDIVVSLLSDYKPDSRLRSSQNRSLLFLRQDITKTFNFFYSNRVVSIWKRLPTDLRKEQSLDGFVRKLNRFNYLKFQNTFNCDNVCSWTSTCECQACA